MNGDWADECPNAAAATLPDLVLLRVLALLPANDVVSVGQVCRHWRQVASRDEVWRLRELDAAVDEEADGRVVARVLRFAPRLASVSVSTTSWSSPGHAARAAVKRALLQPDCKVQRLEDLSCHVDGAWALALLTVHAEHVVEVSTRLVDRAVLEALHTMALHQVLRGLQVWHCDAALRVDAAVTVQDDESDEDYGMEDAEAGGPERGLQWIDIFDLPQETTFSLLRAHRRSLREVTLHVGTSPSTARWRGARRVEAAEAGSLPLQLSACGLRALRHLQLDRYGRAHPLPDCGAQLSDLRRALRPGVEITCRQCEAEKLEKLGKTDHNGKC